MKPKWAKALAVTGLAWLTGTVAAEDIVWRPARPLSAVQRTPCCVGEKEKGPGSAVSRPEPTSVPDVILDEGCSCAAQGPGATPAASAAQPASAATGVHLVVPPAEQPGAGPDVDQPVLMLPAEIRPTSGSDEPAPPRGDAVWVPAPAPEMLSSVDAPAPAPTGVRPVADAGGAPGGAPLPAAAGPQPAAPVVISAGPAPRPAPVHDCGGPGEPCRDTNDTAGIHLLGGAGFYFLKAHPGNDQAFATTTTTVVPFTSTNETPVTSFEHEYGLTPLMWLGFEAEYGLGLRARWWHFHQDDSIFVNDPMLAPGSAGGVTVTSIPIQGLTLAGTATAAAGGGTFLFSNRIHLNVWDFEATEDYKCGNWSVLASAGVRWAMLSQRYDVVHRFGDEGTARFVDVPGLGGLFATITSHTGELFADHVFNGVGPTLSAEGRYDLGATGLALFADARGAVLFGNGKGVVNGTVRTAFASAVGAGTVVANVGGSATGEQTMPVAELELGAEWSKPMNRFTPLLHAGVVSQTWFDAGSPTDVHGNLGFFGFTAAVGIKY